ncbi:hypothetical protein CHGG_10099 [Chaetomium globosum CBS 148.51]|uniref:DNA replication complex GINS protein PSF3 n=1 Tax=Chaetomium globosum (strain ATCC 6205 / CBS 148.51 / DSM 1962 / NBRC 6347 / NRRL 1970) TaxID=306901 RepID=PSF3_CHAGB|nr:uncharacterized protein CHGG_10099 [Chaetomium globosum CBS 148.51]Q2GPK5.1 RecName: Full=DNA replication complex GINS protein PSF3 [Chaetomium globosum CBS 148.51]EAQ83695.1 hypothetical protein CHGG_10099 [Chaetomium globosum CBS 148.51]
MSYYDIDAILTDAEPLKAGTKVNLPLWLAEMLAIANTGDVEGKSFVSFDLPPAMGNDVVQALKADPRAVPLRDHSAHFYGLAIHMMELSEEQELAAALRKTFITRASEVALHAQGPEQDATGRWISIDLIHIDLTRARRLGQLGSRPSNRGLGSASPIPEHCAPHMTKNDELRPLQPADTEVGELLLSLHIELSHPTPTMFSRSDPT